MGVSVQLAGTWMHSLGAASPEATKIVLKSEEMKLDPTKECLILLVSCESPIPPYLESNIELAVPCDNQHPKPEQRS